MRTVLCRIAILAIAVLSGGPLYGDEQPKRIVMKNNTNKTIVYRYRADFNDGKGSNRRYRQVTHKPFAALYLDAPGVPDYAIWLRFPGGRQAQLKYAVRLEARRSPYELRELRGRRDPATDGGAYDIYDAKGNMMEPRQKADSR